MKLSRGVKKQKTKKKQNKKPEKSEQSLKDLQEIIYVPCGPTHWSWESQQRKGKREFEEIVAQNFPIFMNTQIYKSTNSTNFK